MQSDLAAWYALKNWKAYHVTIMNNYFVGKHVDYTGRYFLLIASSEEEAKETAVKFSDDIIDILVKTSYSKKRKILARKNALPITEDKIGSVIQSSASTNYREFITPEGKMFMQLEHGIITRLSLLPE